MITQQKTQQALLLNVKTTGSSDIFRRGPMYPLRVSTKLFGGSQGQSATVIIYGGITSSPSTPLATITLTEGESEEAFTIYSTYEYIMATLTAFTTTKPGTVSVHVNAIEE